MSFPIDKNILYAMELLKNSGYESYIVGGAVRDFVLDVTVSDYDLATNATLDEALEVFKEYKCKKYIGKGITIGVVINHAYFELSTYKGKDILEDLLNRDFRMNSMAIDIHGELYDPYHGVYDLTQGILSCASNEDSVLTYDPIRILRAIRFYATHHTKPDEKLNEAIHRNVKLLEDIKPERVRKELDSILLTEEPSIYLREYSDVFAALFPELGKCIGFDQRNTKWHHLDIYEHTLKVVDSTKCILPLRLAALFHDIGKPECFTLDDKGIGHFYGHPNVSVSITIPLLYKYCYGNIIVNQVCRLIQYHDYNLVDTDKSVMKFLYSFGTLDLDLYFGLRRADILGQNPALLDRIYEMDRIASRCKLLLDENKIITYKNLKIKGNDLAELGFEGEEIGRALELILNKVIKKELKNDSEKLYSYAAELRFHMKEEQ